MKKVLLVVLAAAIVASGVMLLKKRLREKNSALVPEAPIVSVRIVSSKEKVVRQTRGFLAQLSSVDTARMAGRASGLITRVFVTENQKVKKGDLLLQIDDREIRSAIRSLKETLKAQKADLVYARDVHSRNRAMFDVGGLAREKLEASQVARDQKQAVVEGTLARIAAQKIALDYLNIRAPFDGIMGEILLKKGNLATPGQPLLTIHAVLQKLTFSYVPGNFPILPGQIVLMGDEEIGRILKTYADAENALHVAEVALDQPISAPNDSFVSIAVVVFAEKGCTVPLDAVIHEKEGDRVMVYKERRFHGFPVKVLGRDRDYALIDPCPPFPVAVGAQAKLSLLESHKRVRVEEEPIRD
ncbi:efflux transporter, RND family, MFP subunit [delta proteobacterium NaphS2]|nr:efflux transporter, RND family, MFP subunit [delta proteobacterium NaphS2]